MTTEQTRPIEEQWPTASGKDLNTSSCWPINEILLEDLEARGLSDTQIAERYHVSWRQVAALREQLR